MSSRSVAGDWLARREAPAVGEAGFSGDRLLTLLLRAGLVLMTAITALSAALIAAAHISDRYNVNHVSGTWMALADDARDGVLYRPLFENGVFGGTWYMPLEFVLHAAAASMTGELIVSGKLLAYSTALALFGLLYVLLRRIGCSQLASAALVSAVLIAPAGLFAATAIRGDALPVLLQLAAVGLVAQSTSRRSLAIAAVLCTLAISAKLAAVWAPLAILVWLTVRERRRLLPLFAGVLAGSLVLVLGVFELASRGRMSDTLLAVGTSGNAGSSPFESFSRIFDLLTLRTGPIWLLLPFALLALVLAASDRRLTLYQLAFLVELPILLVVFADPGSDFNHLIDLSVLTVLVVGQLWSRAPEYSAIGIAIILALLLGSADSFRQTVKSDVADAVHELRGESTMYPTEPLAGVVSKNDRILSEDPSIPLLLGQRPLLLDAVTVRRVGLDHPEWISDLRGRITGGEFDKIVLVHPITDSAWYAERNFGPVVRDAIRGNYRLDARVDSRSLTYWVYVPKRLR